LLTKGLSQCCGIKKEYLYFTFYPNSPLAPLGRSVNLIAPNPGSGIS
jgi:hypothetical protein